MMDGMHSVMEELGRLKRFTQEFTAFAKIRKPSMEPVNLTAFVRDFAELFGQGWASLQLVDHCEDTPVWVCIDREMIRQVLVNLCNNSALALEGKLGCVEFLINREGSMVALHVTDNGPGISPSIRPRLFEPYATSRKIGEGMGLGLAISRKILLDHGGDLELVRTSAKGAEFRLILPRDQSLLKEGEG